MAKKIRFSLEMENGIEVRSIEELKEHFSLRQVLMYMANGKLVTWLKDRYANDIAEAIEQLDKSDEELPRKLSEIFDVPYDESANESLEKAEERCRKLAILKKYTSEQKYIDVIDNVAFEQDDLYDLLDDDITNIYLCGDSFSIPLAKAGINYYGINNPTVLIDSKNEINWAEKNIILSNVKYDSKYQAVVDAACEAKQNLHGSTRDTIKNTSENSGNAINSYVKNSYLSFMLSPAEQAVSEKSFSKISNEMKNLHYKIDSDIADAKSMLLSAGIVGLASNYIDNL